MYTHCSAKEAAATLWVSLDIKSKKLLSVEGEGEEGKGNVGREIAAYICVSHPVYLSLN